MLKKIISKFQKPKVVILNNEEKVKALSDKAVGLFDHMKKAHSELGVINTELLTIATTEEANINAQIEAHNRELAKKRLTVNNALDEIHMNTQIQTELGKFVR